MKKIIWILLCIFLFVNVGIGEWEIAKAEEIQYYIQVGALTKKESVESLKNKLNRNGYEPYTNLSGKVTRVFVGKYSTEAEAEKDIKKLQSIGIRGFIKSELVNEDVQDNQNLSNSRTNKEDAATESEKANSRDGKNTNETYKNFGLLNDVTINNENGSHVFFFEVSKHWNVENTSYLNLVVSQSQLNDKKDSILTVYINDVPVYTKSLFNKDKSNENIRIQIPVDKITEGFNSVKIRVFRDMAKNMSVEEDNSKNWVVFHKESHVHIDFTDVKDSLKINDYPYPYLNVSNSMPSNSMFIIPDNGTSHLMEAAVILSSNFGQRRRFEDVNINIFKYSDAVEKDQTNVIYIGTKADLPEEILDNLSQAEKYIIESDALIKEIVSPYNKKYKMLMIISNNKENLMKAVQSLCYDNMVMKMNADTQYISSKVAIDIPINEKADYFNLEKLGYSDLLLEGLFRQQVVYRVQIPKSKVIKEGAKVVVKIRYSKIINFEKSLMTIYINNNPIGSKVLSETTADNDSYEIEIPKELLDEEFYDVKIAFDLEMKDSYKKTETQKSVWAFISKESYLYLPFENKVDTYFEDYTSHFIKNNSFNDVLIVMPDNPSNGALKVMANIASFLGHEIEKISNINVIKSNEFWDKHKDKNIIAIGEGINNSFIQNLNEDLHIKFNSSFNKFVSSKKINIPDAYNGNLGVLQLIESPYNENANIMVITSTKEEGLLWCNKYLTNFDYVSQLRGNALTIDESGNINWEKFGDDFDLEINEKEVEEEKTQKEKITRGNQLRNILIFVASILIFVIASTLFLLRKERSRKRRRKRRRGNRR
ncbi:cellulose biosynthesis cyclic di-GMP-binding regulatory protein BcsB [Oceanirhabdus sp. W0125-5]|uniref:cellulose biosynthesis cyclic di-GMP-binding regulatory protein BcsB n=1 Tax=Oceanirhabdus sp. W0125-5 TaxID=2999116 RepID=UPI0022F345EA|nr:cellulose biosynthesis cyclic di-GMP-binding regulatory protein BcsB [Oceanirhabdus sp. W0125-5]WBW98603.1 cellulose biosynthesis cyclic di-GMP-binding regulatory protein BcsB [Oceanirhabdus sp. W0125-5]